jgi:chitinase
VFGLRGSGLALTLVLRYFSPAIASADSRLVFANSILGVYEEFKLDGIDIDYEYPSQEGAAGNLVDAANDTANFLAFLQLLRGVLPTSAKITAAALSRPWAGPDGAPLADVRAFAAVLDWILVMNYDVWGSSAAPGPNAPLADACGNSTQPAANAHTAVQAWSAAGLPPHQITLGLPAYGYLSRSAATSLRGRARKVHAADAGPALTLVNGDGGADNGQVQFRALVAQGALVRAAPGTGGPAFAGAHGFERRWDACSATPFLRSEAAGQVVTYDDPESLALKARFAADAGLRGVNMFDVHGDTDRWDLIDAARAGLYGN